MVVVFFGGLGTYYFKVFQWRHLENPLSDITVVKKTDAGELASFRRNTSPDIIDPALQQLDRLVNLRKNSKAATVLPEDYPQTCKEIANSLLTIMEIAKQRQIPTNYQKKYEEVLLGIADIYKSLRYFEEAAAAEISSEKERAVKSSIEASKSAKIRLTRQRPNFLK